MPHPDLPAPVNVTILDFKAWTAILSTIVSPDVQWVLKGLSEGFFLGVQPGPLVSAKRNCSSAFRGAEIIDKYLEEEIKAGTVAGPFSSPPYASMHVNRFGIIPKSVPGKYRLITDLSFPSGKSVNDLIPDIEASVFYAGLPEAVSKIVRLGKGALLAKFDISRAYRLLPVHPQLRHLLGMHWKGKYFIDLALPFGLRSAPSIFTRFADVLEAILSQQGKVRHVQHYLDDFLILAPPKTNQCQQDLDKSLSICASLGVPIAAGKTEGPSTAITYLGFVLDTDSMELRLPEDKLAKIRSHLAAWVNRKRGTKRELLSLLGLLQHCCQAIVHGRPFLRRLIDRASSVDQLFHFVSLSQWERDDLSWWNQLLSSWNGRSLFYWAKWNKAPDVSISSDAAGALGFAAINQDTWFAGLWPSEAESINIAVKEFIPIVIAAHIWGDSWSRKRIAFKCDNMAVVCALQQGSCRERHLAFLLREFTLLAILHSFTFTAVHIPGVHNKHADWLSRFKFQEFLADVPNAASTSLPIPAGLVGKLLFPPWT